MERILAIDPGEMTGWATGYVDDDDLVIESHGYTPWKEFCLHLGERMAADPPPYDTLVFETWRLRKSSAMDLIGSDMQSTQCIGAIKLSAWQAQRRGHAVRLRGQAPAIKRVIDANKGGTEYLPKSDKDHNKDAVRHMWYYAVHEKGVAP